METGAREPTAHERRATLGLYLGLALVGLLPFLRGLLSGSVLFFRDLGRQFLPLRSFTSAGLARGELWAWNPLLSEGLPLPVPWYPGDLPLALAPGDPWLFSLVLALHVPLAAVAMAALSLRLGLGRPGAAAAGICYALGGFALSSVNLYIFVQALAWAPLMIRALLDAAEGPWRRVALAGLLAGVCFSTFGVELAAQAVLLALLLAAARPLAGWIRLAVSLALGVGLAAPTLLTGLATIAGSSRAGGFDPQQSLAFSLHPLMLPQAVIAGLFGPPETVTWRFLAARLSDGTGYILSFYLGASALALAAYGARRGRLPGWRLLAVAGAALLVCLGPVVRLDLLLVAVPPLTAFRFPVKAWYTVHLCASLLCGAGLDALARAAPLQWRRAAWLCALLGLPLLAAPLGLLAPGALAGGWSWLPSDLDRAAAVREILLDAARGGLVAVALGALLLAVAAGRVRPRVALVAVPALLALDLLRAGVGLNPMTPAANMEATPSMRRLAEEVRETTGRLFSCEPAFSARFHESARRAVGDPDLWVVRSYAESLVPMHNLRLGVATAYGRDVTGVVPLDRVLANDQELACAHVSDILPRLRAAGVARLVAVEPLAVPGLRRLRRQQPVESAALGYWVHAVDAPLPLRSVARRVVPARDEAHARRLAASPGFQAQGAVALEGGAAADGAQGSVRVVVDEPQRIVLEVEAERATAVVLRDAWSAGWSAQLNGAPAPLLRADGRHRAVEVAAGRSRVELCYLPPGLRPGLWAAGVSLALIALLARKQRPAALAQAPDESR